MVQMLVVKFGSLVIKTLTKPVANQIKSQAVHEGIIRQTCLKYGQFHHNIESRVALRLAGHHAKSIKPMNEDSAVQLGANVLSEFFVFTTAGVLLAYEIYKKNRDDEVAKVQKDAAAKKEKDATENRFVQLEQQIADLTRKNEELKSQLITLHVRVLGEEEETKHELEDLSKQLQKSFDNSNFPKKKSWWWW